VSAATTAIKRLIICNMVLYPLTESNHAKKWL
jgi:hypothetical protein